MLTVKTRRPRPAGEGMAIAVFWESRYLPYCKETLQLTGRPRKKPSTIRGYEQIWRQHLKSHFGNITLQEYEAHMGTQLLQTSPHAAQGQTEAHQSPGRIADGLHIHFLQHPNAIPLIFLVLGVQASVPARVCPCGQVRTSRPAWRRRYLRCLGRRSYAFDVMAKAFPSMAGLEARIMNRLQEQRRGQTLEELQEYLREPAGRILSVLVPLRAEGFVAKSARGVWTMVRDDSASEWPKPA